MILLRRQVFQRLQDAKTKKCKFGMARCGISRTYCGKWLRISRVNQTRSCLVIPVPKTKKEVCGFLGLTGYYRKFIQDFATTAAPISDLTRKNAPTRVQWTPVCDQGFTKLNAQNLC